MPSTSETFRGSQNAEEDGNADLPGRASQRSPVRRHGFGMRRRHCRERVQRPLRAASDHVDARRSVRVSVVEHGAANRISGPP